MSAVKTSELWEARTLANTDAIGAVVAHVQHEYGHTGYVIGQCFNTGAVSVFEVRHFDGSAFNLIADRWGNVKRIPDDADEQYREQMVRDMHKIATTA